MEPGDRSRGGLSFARALLAPALAAAVLTGCSLLLSTSGLTGDARADATAPDTAGAVGDAGLSEASGSDATTTDASADARGGDASCSRTFTNKGASSVQDTFASGSLSSKWTATSPCIGVVGGELVAAPPSLSNQYCHTWTAGSVHLSCDSVTVRVLETTTTLAGAQTYIYVASLDDRHRLNLLYEGGGFTLGSPTDGTSISVPGGLDLQSESWWRLRESDGELYFETSADGSSWITRGHGPDPMDLDAVQIAIGAGTYMPLPSPGQARFHCFNTSPPCQ